MKRYVALLVVAASGAALAVTLGRHPAGRAPAPSAAPVPSPSPDVTPVHGYRVVQAYPHDRKAFTQGLLYMNGRLFESTGLHGESTLREVEVETGRVIRQIEIPEAYFAEGLADWGETLVQLTWTTGVAFVYDRATFRKLRELRFTGEGWGLTRMDRRLIMSDGTPVLRVLDPETFEVVSRVRVHDEHGPVTAINELEMVKGALYANVWQSHRLAMIDPESGRITGWIDLTGLLPASERSRVDVLNGIAYDAEGDRLFVTGKWWPHVYQIEVVMR